MRLNAAKPRNPRVIYIYVNIRHIGVYWEKNMEVTI